MLNEKIVYYRKKNMLTQEELAYQLNVSRQTVTKWETGTIYPNIEYLIKLSNLFGVSIDYLVKEDDCLTLETHKIEISELACFLVKAKKATYANKTNKVNSSRKESHDYSYQENNYTYLDSFFGAENFSGQEIVYKDGKPCWSMNYYIKKGSIFTCCVFKEKLIFFRVLKKYIIKHIKFMKDLYKAEL